MEQVAQLSGVSVRTVRRISREPPVTAVDDAAARAARGVGRPSTTENFRKFVVDLLAGEPRLLTGELLRRARQAGYAGGSSAFYELVRTIRPPRPAYEARFEGLAGEFSQHDFGELDVRFADGSVRLKYSRWSEVSIVPDQRVESLLRAIHRHFESFGGIPLLAVFDRPRTIVLESGHDGRVKVWNPAFAQAMFELGVSVELCWAYSPEQKGAVENLVKWVKGSFLKQRVFQDEADLDRQLAEWLAETNASRPSRATGQPPAARIGEERARMRPLRLAPGELPIRHAVQVGPTADVVFDTNAYSMPPRACGMAATLYLYPDRVRIVAGDFVAEHPRLRGRRQKSILDEHRRDQLAAVAGQRGRRYLKRQLLLEIGPEMVAYMTDLVHRKPRTWFDDLDALYENLEMFGAETLRLAVARAAAESLYGAEYVDHFLPQVLRELHPGETA
jgi:transposase